MKKLKQFIIPFSGLPEGEHWFSFDIDDSFFELFEKQDILKADILLKLLFIKRSTMLELEFNFSGNVEVECDRCLESVVIPIESTEKIFVKFGDENYNNSEEILIIPHGDPEIDIANLVYEMVVVALPMKRVHNDDNCNIDKHTFDNNSDNDDNIDPRWDQLKNL